eukprot:PITA_22845
MDFIMGLPIVQGKDCIYLVVDWLTKYAHFFTIPTRYSASQVVELFFREIFRLHDLPKNIVSDRDSRFMGGLWQELFRLVENVCRYAPNRETFQGGGFGVTPVTFVQAVHFEAKGNQEATTPFLWTIQGSPTSWGGGLRARAASSEQIDNIFHVSCLKKVLGQQVTTVVELPPLDEEGHLVLELEAILERRERKLRNRTIREFLALEESAG